MLKSRKVPAGTFRGTKKRFRCHEEIKRVSFGGSGKPWPSPALKSKGSQSPFFPKPNERRSGLLDGPIEASREGQRFRLASCRIIQAGRNVWGLPGSDCPMAAAEGRERGEFVIRWG